MLKSWQRSVNLTIIAYKPSFTIVMAMFVIVLFFYDYDCMLLSKYGFNLWRIYIFLDVRSANYLNTLTKQLMNGELEKLQRILLKLR